MIRSFVRATVSDSVLFEGLGLHSGLLVKVTVHPGQDGIAFRQGGTRIEAKPENISDTTRCTQLGSVSTIEHLMSAFGGLGITDAEVEVDGPELPALDGCALEFALGLQSAGRADLGTREFEGPFARVYVKDDPVVVAVAQGEGHWRYRFVCEDRWFKEQTLDLVLGQDSYLIEIAPARTFGFEEELEHIRALGLAKGLNETNAFVIGRDRYVNPVKFDDEPVRHKMLDLIGDLMLAGIPIGQLSVTAERSGHKANVAAAMKLAESIRFSGR